MKYNLVFKNYFLLFSGFCLCVCVGGGGRGLTLHLKCVIFLTGNYIHGCKGTGNAQKKKFFRIACGYAYELQDIIPLHL